MSEFWIYAKHNVRCSLNCFSTWPDCWIKQNQIINGFVWIISLIKKNNYIIFVYFKWLVYLGLSHFQSINFICFFNISRIVRNSKIRIIQWLKSINGLLFLVSKLLNIYTDHKKGKLSLYSFSWADEHRKCISIFRQLVFVYLLVLWW